MPHQGKVIGSGNLKIPEKKYYMFFQFCDISHFTKPHTLTPPDHIRTTYHLHSESMRIIVLGTELPRPRLLDRRAAEKHSHKNWYCHTALFIFPSSMAYPA